MFKSTEEDLTRRMYIIQRIKLILPACIGRQELDTCTVTRSGSALLANTSLCM